MSKYLRYRYDLRDVYRGDSFWASFRIGDLFDLALCEVKAEIVRQLEDSRPGIALDVQKDGQTLTLTKPADQVKNIPKGNYFYYVQFTLPLEPGETEPYRHTLFWGDFIV